MRANGNGAGPFPRGDGRRRDRRAIPGYRNGSGPAGPHEPAISSDGLRILMTTDTVGGVWNYALELSAALAARSVRVGLATMGGEPDPRQRDQAAAVPGLRLFVSDYDLEWMDDPWGDVARAGDWLLSLEREFRPDVVHLNGYVHGALPFRAPVVVVGHSCVLSWWEAVQGGPVPSRYRRYHRSVLRGLNGAGRVVAPTAAMLRLLERHYTPLPHGAVVLNGRSGARFRPGPSEKLIFACGRLWDEAKNLVALERAAPEVPWPIEVVGSLRHPDGREIRPREVRCRGVLSPREVAGRMRRASICAHPARYEPFGLVPLEAALSGCGLVLGDVPTLREIWGDTALYVNPDDPAELARALRRLASRRDLRERLARRARERALRLTPRRMAEQYLGHYWSLLASRLRSGGAARPLAPAAARYTRETAR